MSFSSFHLQLRDARRERGLTQAELARQAGCTQSALSMFESGQGSALATDTLKKISTLLGVAFDETPSALPGVSRKTFCPNFECPSSVPYFVGAELFIRPAFFNAIPNAKYCPHCAELLLTTCPNCNAQLPETPGACCMVCGKSYVLATPSSPREWLRKRREELRENGHSCPFSRAETDKNVRSPLF